MKKLNLILLSSVLTLFLYYSVKSLFLYVFIIQLNYPSDIMNSNTMKAYLKISLIISFILSVIISKFIITKIKISNESNIRNKIINENYSFKEFKRPWKLTSLIIGIMLLVVGSKIAKLPDWDIPISIIMALLTYLFGPWTLFNIIKNYLQNKIIIKNLMIWAICLFFAVDFSYIVYNEINHNMYFRLYNLLASSVLYMICSLFWLFPGSFNEYEKELLKVKISYSNNDYRSK